MADNKQPKDKEFSTNKEVERSKEFQQKVDLKEDAMEIAHDLLISTTENEFEKLGYEKSNKEAGFYANDKPYGAGAEEDKFSVKLEGKTKTNITKKVMLGARRLQSDINFEYHKNHITVEYVSTEQGVFMGPGKKGKFAMSDKITVDASDKNELTKKLKEFFKKAASKEISYITNMKLDTENTQERTNISENKKTTMKKLTIASLFNLNEGKTKDKEIEKNKERNTHPDKHNSKKSIFFDEKKEDKGFKTIDEREKEIAEEVKSVSEISMAGPSGAGAGAFLTPNFLKKDVKETSYYKNKHNKKPKIDKDYNVVPQKQKDSFWTPAIVDPHTHVQGHPGVKPGSAAEMKIASKGLNESIDSKLNLDLTRKKFFLESENIEKGINKRYLITEKSSDEYTKERWKKISNLKANETIKEAEEMRGIIEKAHDIKNVIDEIIIEEQTSVEKAKGTTPEVVSEQTNKSGKETVTVLKPGSTFGIEYTFLKEDFLNESKKYILELNSRVYVPNPNSI